MSSTSTTPKIRVPTSKRKNAHKPWHTHLTIDLLAEVLSKTIFHPFIAWMIPLSLRAVTIPYEFFSMRLAIAYASFLTIFWIFSGLNARIAFGLPRDVDLEEEVIVITGGGSGLGRLVADFYAMKGASVAVLDIKMIEEESSGLRYYQCDVGDSKQVERCAKMIRDDLGVPTILINNAAIMNGISLLDLSAEEVEKNFRVNLLSHFHTIRTFLPGMLEGGRGTIVTVASVLGYLGCAHLADYTAAKAGLFALHSSLRAELSNSSDPAASNIKTILVAPGQLGTPLFSGLRTPSDFLAPVVEPVDLAREIVRVIDTGCSGEIFTPFYAQWIPMLPAFPVGLQKIVRSLSGMDTAMIEMSKKKRAS